MRRQVIQHERDRLVDVRRVYGVIVVESQHGRAGQQVKVVDQAHHGILGLSGAARFQQGDRVNAHSWFGDPDRGDQMRQKPRVSASPGSKANHATVDSAKPEEVSHWVISVVLPKPAGAAIRTSRGAL